MIVYLLLRGFLFVFKWIPYSLMYACSPILRIILQYVVGYRKSTIHENLTTCFPNKTQEEIKVITDDFNKYLADLFLESLKGLSSSSHSIMQRMNILNIESIKSQIKNGRSVILAGTHYCNWEWGVFPFGKEFGKDCLGFYKPIANKYIDNYIRNGRQKDGIQMVSIKDTRLHFSEDNHKRVYVLIADQNPSNLKEAIWCNFMGKDTACLHGVEKYARQYDMPVYYIHNAYTGRGRYQISFELITENPNALPHGAITTKYMGLLENELKAEPRYWLWSHKRWKHTREVIRS